MFWVLVEMDLCTVISERPCLSPTLHDQYEPHTNFKANVHNVYVCAMRDLKNLWHKLPYLVGEANVAEVVGKWLGEWLYPSYLGAGTSKAVEGTTA